MEMIVWDQVFRIYTWQIGVTGVLIVYGRKTT